MAYYLVQVSLIVSSADFDPCVLTDVSSDFKRSWRKGDLVRVNSPMKFDTSGVSYELLDRIEDPFWVETLIVPLEEWIGKFRHKFALIPSPLISVCIWTGGTDFPSNYFSRQLLNLIEEMKAELDIDIITTSELDKCEDDCDL